MVDVFLVVSICFFSVFLLGGVVILLIKFSHPDDHNQAWVPKIITVRVCVWMCVSVRCVRESCGVL